MKKIKKLLIASVATFSLSLSLFMLNPQIEVKAATTHTVQTGDTLWKIASKYGVAVGQLKTINNRTSDLLYPGQKLTIPNSTISEADKDLMARLVHAEAKGEPYAGKVAVATVVLNRVMHPEFPNTVSGVVNEISGGHYAFTPVQSGTIKQPADAAAKQAVSEALAYRGQGKGSIYFYNPKTAVSQWIFSREVTVTIGNHRFAK